MNKKVLLLPTFVFLMPFLLLFGGYQMLTSHIYNNQTCKSFNIDHLELRTGILIPKVLPEAYKCKCEIAQQTRTASYVLDKNDVDLDEFIESNDFEFSNGQYIASGRDKKTLWEARFDKASAKLDFYLKYQQ
ncbi:MAG: hypothetical protein AAF849_11400 [Bacteroidota bacterium]